MIEITLHGTNEARCMGFSHKEDWKRGPIAPVCRKLLSVGYDKEDLVKVTRDGQVVFKPLPIGVWAELQILESEDKPVGFRKYTPLNYTWEK